MRTRDTARNRSAAGAISARLGRPQACRRDVERLYADFLNWTAISYLPLLRGRERTTSQR
jgi:hypothetical protein